MHKRFISISVIALIMTSSTAAFAQLTETSSVPEQNAPQAIQQVQVATPVVSTPPTRPQGVLSGPVRVSSLTQGPVFSTEEAEIGSVEWLAQEKARQDKIESDAERKQAELEAEIARLEKVAKDTKNLNKAIAATKKYVGKTWYVLSGSTPDGWDCSGLVMWTYGHLGINLYHSASVQKESGTFVDEPKIGDIVAFTYQGASRAFHTAIYVGGGEMLHSGGKKGDRTEITSIARWAKGNANAVVTYTRIVETNN